MGFLWWCLQGSNQGHMDFQSIALPSELRHHCFNAGANIVPFFSFSKTILKIKLILFAQANTNLNLTKKKARIKLIFKSLAFYSKRKENCCIHFILLK